MRIHLLLRDADQRVLKEDSFESSLVSIGQPDHMMFAHRGLPRLDVVSDGYYAKLVRLAGAAVVAEDRLTRRNRFDVGDLRLHVDLYPRPDAVPRTRGVCPSGGDALVERQAGGAYRAIARRERRCASCQSVVLGLHEAPGILGRFTDRSALDWVHVTVSNRCPECLDSMSRAVFATDRGEIEVERCLRCRLVVLDPGDEQRLRGG